MNEPHIPTLRQVKSLMLLMHEHGISELALGALRIVRAPNKLSPQLKNNPKPEMKETTMNQIQNVSHDTSAKSQSEMLDDLLNYGNDE